MALRLRRGTDTERQLITPAEGEMIYVTDTKELYVGDGTTVGGIRITGESTDFLYQLDDVGAPAPLNGEILVYNEAETEWQNRELNTDAIADIDTLGIVDNDVLVFDSLTNTFIPANSLSTRITTTDGSTLIIDTDTAQIFGSLIGTVDGDLKGSVFGDDSTPLVDAVNSAIVVRTLSDSGETMVDTVFNELNASFIRSRDDIDPQIDIVKTSTGDLTGYAGRIGDIQFKTAGTDGEKTYNIITTYPSGIILANNDNGVDFPADTLNTFTKTGVVLGGIGPQARLDVRGNAIINGDLTANAIKGTIVSDDSSIIIDGNTGSLVTTNIDIVGTTGSPSVGAGDLANVNEWLQVTVNGNTRYIPLYA